MPWFDIAMVGAIAILVIYLLVIAIGMRVDYYDSYESLLNARAILHGDGAYYTILRPILYPVLLVPIFLLDNLGNADMAEFVAVHVLAVLLFALFLYVAFRLFSLHLSRPWALAGVLVLSWNLLLINNAPLAKEDIPGALFATAAFYFYLRARKTGRLRHFLLPAVMIAATIGTRYNLAPLPFAVIGSYEVVNFIRQPATARWRWANGRLLLIKAVCLFGLPVAIFLLIPTVVYPLIHRASGLAGPFQWLSDIHSLVSSMSIFVDPNRNYRFLVESLTWPLLACAAFGAVVSVRLRKPGTLLYLLWFVIFFGAQTYLIAGKEARYLFASFPPLYFFAARGLEGVSGLSIAFPRVRAGQAVRVLLLAGLLLVPASTALAAAARFMDPVYNTNYEAQVSRYAANLAGAGNNVYWVGPFYPLHPHDYLFDVDDPVTYIYHYYAYQASFWTHRWVYALVGAQVLVPDTGAPPFVYQGNGNSLKDGDVLIVNAAPESYNAADMPPSLNPLVVEQANTAVFTSSSSQDPAASLFTSQASPGSIRVRQEGPEYVVEGAGIPDGQFELYAAERDSTSLRALGLLAVSSGNFKVGVPAGVWPAGSAEKKLVLLYYGMATPFPAPGG